MKPINPLHCFGLVAFLIMSTVAQATEENEPPAGLQLVPKLPASLAKEHVEGKAGNGRTGNVPKIVNGKPAKSGDFPWQAALILSSVPKGDPRSGFFCAGTVVAPGWVLTAAHCTFDEPQKKGDPKVPFQASEIDVYLGSINFSGGIRTSIEKIARHKDYDPKTQDNDIALLKLSSNAAITAIKPVSLIDAGQEIEDGENVVVVGWGSTAAGEQTSPTASPTLQYADEMSVQRSEDCNTGHLNYLRTIYASYLKESGFTESSIVTALGMTYPISKKVLTPNMFCAGTGLPDDAPQVKPADSCFGDSGGPLLVERGGEKVQAGVVSWGPLGACAITSVYGVYVKLSNYADWIAQQISEQ